MTKQLSGKPIECVPRRQGMGRLDPLPDGRRWNGTIKSQGPVPAASGSPDVKTTQCPSPAAFGPAARLHVDPRSRPFGAGFTAVGQGFDVTTGRPWTK